MPDIDYVTTPVQFLPENVPVGRIFLNQKQQNLMRVSTWHENKPDVEAWEGTDLGILSADPTIIVSAGDIQGDITQSTVYLVEDSRAFPPEETVQPVKEAEEPATGLPGIDDLGIDDLLRKAEELGARVGVTVPKDEYGATVWDDGDVEPEPEPKPETEPVVVAEDPLPEEVLEPALPVDEQGELEGLGALDESITSIPKYTGSMDTKKAQVYNRVAAAGGVLSKNDFFAYASGPDGPWMERDDEFIQVRLVQSVALLQEDGYPIQQNENFIWIGDGVNLPEVPIVAPQLEVELHLREEPMVPGCTTEALSENTRRYVAECIADIFEGIADQIRKQAHQEE